MDALARQTFGGNFSFNASSSSPPGPCSNLADVVRRVVVVVVGGCVVAGPTLMHPKRVKLRPATSQTTLRLSAKRHRTLPPFLALSLVLCLLWFPSLRHTGSTQFTRHRKPSPSGSSNPKLQGASRLSSGTKVSAGAGSCRAENGGHLHAAFVLPSYFRVRSVAHESQRCLSSLVSRRIAV